MKIKECALLAVMTVSVLSACAENWNYDIKSRHHDEKTGRYYVVCKSEFSETYKEVDVTADVFNLLKIDKECPAPMSTSPTPSPTISTAETTQAPPTT